MDGEQWLVRGPPVSAGRSASRGRLGSASRRLRAPFVGDEPLVGLTRENGDIQVEVLRRDQPSDVRPRWLHVMVWDPSEERLVNVRVPLWLLRFGDNATVNFSETDGDVVGDLDLTLDDLDHHGPGLVLDYQDADRERVLLWAE